MALSKLNTDVSNVSKFDNTPSDDPGYTSKATRASTIKAQMDKAANDIKNYLNNTLTPEIDTLLALAGAYPSADVTAVINLLSQSKRNLLHNWDFASLVNQRAQSSYAGAGYGIDRWTASNSGFTVTVATGYVEIACSSVTGGAYTQSIEQDITGKTVTVSVELQDGTISSKTFASVAQATVNQQISTNAFLRIAYSSSRYNIGIYFNAATSIQVKRIKAEVGTTSTLANDAPGEYGERLSLCQRFAIPMSRRVRATSVTTNTITYFLATPVTMRTNPSLESGGTIRVETLGQAAQTDFTFAYVAGAGGITVTATKSAHGLSDAVLYIAGTLTADI